MDGKTSVDKVPMEYWEYKLLDGFFRGNWLAYINTPNDVVEMIEKFIVMEAEAASYGREK